MTAQTNDSFAKTSNTSSEPNLGAFELLAASATNRQSARDNENAVSSFFDVPHLENFATTNSGTTKTRSSYDSFFEPEEQSIAGMDKFDSLLETVSGIPDGALKDLHYAALEGVLQSSLPVEQIQNLLPEAAKQFGELFRDAQSGGHSGASTLNRLRDFQAQLNGTFDVRMEMSDSGLLLGDGLESSAGLTSWAFVPAQGAVESGARYVRGSGPVSLELSPDKVVQRIRDRLSGALNTAAAS